MLNDTALEGRLTADPELKYVGDNIPVLEFTLASDRDYIDAEGNRPTDFIDAIAWRGTAEFISKYFTKGRRILVRGRSQVRRWRDQDGGKHRRTEILVEAAYFGDSKKPEQESGPFEELPNNEPVPFN